MAALDDYLTLQEAATELGIHPDSLRRLVAHGRVAGAVKWRDKRWLFDRATFAQFAASYRAMPGRPPKGLFD